ncbi:MAG TPA: hypothetical protein VID27_11905, partial [Blastocatellia bacterium]
MGEASTKQLSEQKKRPANVNTQDAAVRSAPDRPILRLKPGVGLLLVWMAIASFAQTSAKSDFPIGRYVDGDFTVTF